MSVKSAALGWALGAIAAIAAASCLVDRRSDALVCSVSDDCDTDRVCEGGFCVKAECPGDCTSCDVQERTCTMSCTANNHCGNVTCPSGWSCNIICSANNACSNITCEGGASCTIDCQSQGACDAIDCSDACKCDVTCDSGHCDANTCPVRSGTSCEDSASGNCTSAPAGCNAC